MEEYNDILSKVKELKRPVTEKNIFSIGGRGHYENPISDILAFFIDPKEEHGFGELFLRSLFETTGRDKLLLELAEPPRREQFTDEGNRIDLIVEGEKWVLVIENKIRHQAINPFKDYDDFINDKYNEKDNKVFILLTIKDEVAPKNWLSVTYSKFVERIKNNIGFHLLSANNNKWLVILREFILNIESEYGENNMDSERIKFVKSNYAKIQEIKDMLGEYIEYMREKGLEVINSVSGKNDIAFSKQQDWGEKGTALRLISKDWGKGTNITLLLGRDGFFRIQFYVYEIPDEEINNLKGHIDQDKYKEYWVESKTVRCFGFFDRNTEDEIFSEIDDLAKKLNAYFSSHEAET